MAKPVILGGIACLLASPTFAQQKTDELAAKAKAEAEALKNPDPWKRRVPIIDFVGAPFGAVVDSLNQLFPEIKFFMESDVSVMPIYLHMSNPTLEDILTAIEVTTMRHGMNECALKVNKANDHLITFSCRPPDDQKAASPICRAFSLERYLADKSQAEGVAAIAQVEDALKMSWQMWEVHARQHREKPEFFFHRGTKLMIIVGYPQEVGMAEQLIGQLEGISEPLPSPAVGPAVPPPQIRPLPPAPPGSK